MRENEIRELYKFPKQIDSDRLTRFRESVSVGLKLEEGTLPDHVNERLRVVEVISDTAYEISDYLGIGIPKLRLLYEWGDEIGRSTYRNIAASSEEGIIKFSPNYLRLAVNNFYKKGVRDKSQVSELVDTTAHEVYHCHQWNRFPNALKADCSKDFASFVLARKYDIEIGRVRYSRSERGARMFAEVVKKTKNKYS